MKAHALINSTAPRRPDDVVRRPWPLRALVLAVLVAGAGAVVAFASAGGSGEPTARHYAIRGIYDRDTSGTGFDEQAALGFSAIDSGPYRDQMDALAQRGLKGIVWLGPYSNETCRFARSDGWVRSHVAPIAGHPAVGAYFVDDEPDADKCPDAPSEIEARAALVKSIDPRPPTLIVMYKVDQLERFAGTVDVIGLDHYPCSLRNGCDYAVIDEQAAVADRLGIRYWGVIQAFGDDWYRLPTPHELHSQFLFWRATRMEGYLVFAWRWPRDRPEQWLANRPELRSQLASENAPPPTR
jgi:hypothetical protein